VTDQADATTADAGDGCGPDRAGSVQREHVPPKKGMSAEPDNRQEPSVRGRWLVARVIAVVGRLRLVGVVGVVLAMLAGAGCSGSSPKTPIGTIADVGFRPNANGFTFQNYGDTLSDGSIPTNLTAADLRSMFGDVVCASNVFGRCSLLPEAQAWLDSTNQAMAGGHCFGFSVAAELLWQQKLNPGKFGAPDTSALAIGNNQVLQRQIAYDWALQLLNSVQSKRITGTPNQILATLRKVLTAHPSETYTIAIWKRDGTGGHAVTPYAVVNKGGGQFEVMIYDNNWPDMSRAISFDTKADTWSYDATIIPTQPDEIYQGDAVTKSVSLFPTSPGQGTQKCPAGRRPQAAPGRRATPRRSTSRAATPTGAILSSPITPGTGSATSTARWSTRSPAPTSIR
jgi:hypothetical protein